MIQTTPDRSLNLPLSVVDAIFLHGDITERIARDRHKLDSLATIRAGLEPSLAECLLRDNVRRNEALLSSLTTLLYGGE